MDRASIPDMKKKMTQFLEFSGMGTWETAALVHLLIEGKSTATQIASGADIPKNKVYDVVEGLEKRSLIFQPFMAGKAKLYQAARPEEIFQRLLTPFAHMARIESEIKGALVELYEGAVEGAEEVTVDEIVSVTDSRVALSSMLHKQFKGALQDVRLLGASFDWLTDTPSLLAELRARAAAGVPVKILSTSPAKLPLALANSGFETRVGQSQHTPSITIDRQCVFLAVRKGPTKATENQEVFLRVANAQLAAEAARAFDAAWQDAKEAEYDG